MPLICWFVAASVSVRAAPVVAEGSVIEEDMTDVVGRGTCVTKALGLLCMLSVRGGMMALLESGVYGALSRFCPFYSV